MISDLATYSLSDFLMFAPETYFRLYVLYNAAVWPAQVAAAALALAAIALTRRAGAWQGRLLSALIGGAWAVIAWWFFLGHYADINLLAPWLAALFAIQAVLMVGVGGAAGRLQLGWRASGTGLLGLGVVIFAVLVHPLIGLAAGRTWTGVELFGLAPDPTALGTLGLLLMTPWRQRWVLALLPLLWCILSGLTYLAMGVPHGLITPLMGVAAAGATLVRR